MYRVLVRCQGRTRQAMVDSGYTQTLVYQNLVRSGVLVEAIFMEVRYVHGDIDKSLIVPLEMRYSGKCIKLRLHSLILGTDFPVQADIALYYL